MRARFLLCRKSSAASTNTSGDSLADSPRINKWSALKQVPARTDESDAMSKDLIGRGFKFVGSTICYAMMQATGMVNDHLVDCERYKVLTRAAKR